MQKAASPASNSRTTESSMVLGNAQITSKVRQLCLAFFFCRLFPLKPVETCQRWSCATVLSKCAIFLIFLALSHTTCRISTKAIPTLMRQVFCRRYKRPILQDFEFDSIASSWARGQLETTMIVSFCSRPLFIYGCPLLDPSTFPFDRVQVEREEGQKGAIALSAF